MKSNMFLTFLQIACVAFAMLPTLAHGQSDTLAISGTFQILSKGGMLSMTKSIAREFGHLGIRANAICPTMIETPMLDGLTEERLRGIIDAIPLKRTGTTREAAGACLFLASELSGFVTGATIDVNGGTHIH